jgi:hypothetical protein
MGWSEPSVQILDGDLGKSGAQITGREDFKTLVAEVSMGQVGAIFALEVSRLARAVTTGTPQGGPLTPLTQKVILAVSLAWR